jgi:transcriptional regulator with XRE-family HTH domain
MTTMVVSTNAYAEKIADALRMKWGDHRSSAKEIAGRIGAGVGTVRKWLRGENGPSGEHLLKLIAESDEVWAVVVELEPPGSVGRGAGAHASCPGNP